ncbi:hypothetical protein HDV05_004057 [Chytridiales sp. JEL 0842]|nr:hypothetical protein HDV05_004057 [Chytridiales sp. JEL 0842]
MESALDLFNLLSTISSNHGLPSSSLKLSPPIQLRRACKAFLFALVLLSTGKALVNQPNIDINESPIVYTEKSFLTDSRTIDLTTIDSAASEDLETSILDLIIKFGQLAYPHGYLVDVTQKVQERRAGPHQDVCIINNDTQNQSVLLQLKIQKTRDFAMVARRKLPGHKRAGGAASEVDQRYLLAVVYLGLIKNSASKDREVARKGEEEPACRELRSFMDATKWTIGELVDLNEKILALTDAVEELCMKYSKF